MNDMPGDAPERKVIARLYLLSALPAVGVLLFALAGFLALRVFSHNSSFGCADAPVVFQSGGTACTHESYVLPVVIGALALTLVMGGGAFASYYAAKHVGAPLVAALRRRQRGLDP